MIYLVGFLLLIIIILLIYIIWQKSHIKKLNASINDHSIDKVKDDKLTDYLFWARFPFYCCLIFVLILFVIVFLTSTGIYKLSTLQLLFLTFSSFFFVSSDLCLVGINLKTNGIAPKWLEKMYVKTSKNAYKRFFWIAFACFVVSFIFQPYEPKSIKELLDNYNVAFGAVSLAFVIFIYGVRSLEAVSKYLIKE